MKMEPINRCADYPAFTVVLTSCLFKGLTFSWIPKATFEIKILKSTSQFTKTVKSFEIVVYETKKMCHLLKIQFTKSILYGERFFSEQRFMKPFLSYENSKLLND